jgi:hypothetical protein
MTKMTFHVRCDDVWRRDQRNHRPFNRLTVTRLGDFCNFVFACKVIAAPSTRQEDFSNFFDRKRRLLCFTSFLRSSWLKLIRMESWIDFEWSGLLLLRTKG